jgi:hypothetical protein
MLIDQDQGDHAHAQHSGRETRDAVKPFFRRSIQQIEGPQRFQPLRFVRGLLSF